MLAFCAILIGVTTPLSHPIEPLPLSHPAANITARQNDVKVAHAINVHIVEDDHHSVHLGQHNRTTRLQPTPLPPPPRELNVSAVRERMLWKARSIFSDAAGVVVMRPLEVCVAAGVVIAALGSVWVFWTLASINPAVPIAHKFGPSQVSQAHISVMAHTFSLHLAYCVQVSNAFPKAPLSHFPGAPLGDLSLRGTTHF